MSSSNCINAVEKQCINISVWPFGVSPACDRAHTFFIVVYDRKKWSVDQIFIGWSSAGAYGNDCHSYFALRYRVYFSVSKVFGILALLRDVIIFVPASIMIAMITKSIISMLWAAVISDVVAAIVAFAFVSTEIHKLEKM